MALDPQQNLHLIDSPGNMLGSVSIVRIEGDRVFAQFSAGAGFARVELKLREFEEAVNDQLFDEADHPLHRIDKGAYLGDLGADMYGDAFDVYAVRLARFGVERARGVVFGSDLEKYPLRPARGGGLVQGRERRARQPPAAQIGVGRDAQ